MRLRTWWAWTACLDGMFLSSAVVTVSYMLSERDERGYDGSTNTTGFRSTRSFRFHPDATT